MHALRFRRHRRNVLIADDDQRWSRDSVELVVNPRTIDHTVDCTGDANAVVGDHAFTPFVLLFAAAGIAQKLLPEHDRHHPIGHESQTKPACDEVEQAIATDVLLWLRVC